MKKIIFLFLILSLNYNLFSQNFKPKNIQTDVGLVSGFAMPSGDVNVFLGIPYAAPPVGKLRWKAPQAVRPWRGVKACVAPPASAMQGKPEPYMCWTREFMAPQSPMSEDCLYLNVWSAAESPAAKLPVVVWVHGGGFVAGSGTVPLYDGEQMARKGVVYVTINYRLGIFGYLAHPQLSAENAQRVSGNYGLLDQVAALQWVQRNIAAFGGDPANVTIAGQSAGAYSVCALMVSPLAKGLFSKVIAHSGGLFSKTLLKAKPLDEKELEGQQLTQKLGVRRMSDLRKWPADSLVKLYWNWGLTTDGYVLPDARTAFEAGNQHDVPLLTGWNIDDGVDFSQPTAAQLREKMEAQLGEKAQATAQFFGLNSDEDALKINKLLNQFTFAWNNYTWARLHARTGSQKVFVYWFTHVPPGEPQFGAFHSAEFAYALNTLRRWQRPFADYDFELANAMATYWTNFAKYGDPNDKNLPNWPEFKQEKQVMELGDKIHSCELPYSKYWPFLDTIF